MVSSQSKEYLYVDEYGYESHSDESLYWLQSKLIQTGNGYEIVDLHLDLDFQSSLFEFSCLREVQCRNKSPNCVSEWIANPYHNKFRWSKMSMEQNVPRSKIRSLLRKNNKK